MRYNWLAQLITVILLCITLNSCMVGPNFSPPPPPDIDSYTPSPKVTKTTNIPSAGQAGKAQHIQYCKDIPGYWWYLFHSEELNALIEQGLANNPNVAAAKASLIQAQELLKAQIGSTLLPLVTGQFTGQRQRFNSASLGGTVSTIFNLFNTSVNVSYTLDLFGGLRRQIEAFGAEAEFQHFELEGAFLTLSANIVTTAVTIAGLREQIKATHDLIREESDNLRIVKAQFTLGGTSKADVLQQEAQLAQVQGTLPPLEQKLSTNYHALSVLIGELPSEDRLPKFDLNKLHLPTYLPVSIPSLLVRQRPDVRAAEALLHQASAQIGVATANLFPQLNLTGTYGFQSSILSQLLNQKNIFWLWGGQITETIFNGGALIAQRKAAIANFQAVAAQYRQTVLQAFQNVADALRALEHDAQAFKAEKAAETAARESLRLVEKQYFLGGVNYLALLIAQRTYEQARINRIIAQSTRYSDTAALFQALGGAWWNREPLACSEALAQNLCQYEPEHFMPCRNEKPTILPRQVPCPVKMVLTGEG